MQNVSKARTYVTYEDLVCSPSTVWVHEDVCLVVVLSVMYFRATLGYSLKAKTAQDQHAG